MEYLEDVEEAAINKTIDKLFGNADPLLACAYKMTNSDADENAYLDALQKMKQMNEKIAREYMETFESTMDSQGNIIPIVETIIDYVGGK